jgi:uncharacterized protein (UPF0333 family)
MRLSDTGAGRTKALLSLVFLVIVIFVGIKVIPVYVNDYQLDDFVRQQTPYWLTQRARADAIQKAVLDKAQDLGLPVTADNVKVEAPGSLVNVSLDYTVPVDLLVATLPLHFTHSAENRQL